MKQLSCHQGPTSHPRPSSLMKFWTKCITSLSDQLSRVTPSLQTPSRQLKQQSASFNFGKSTFGSEKPNQWTNCFAVTFFALELPCRFFCCVNGPPTMRSLRTSLECTQSMLDMDRFNWLVHMVHMTRESLQRPLFYPQLK